MMKKVCHIVSYYIGSNLYKKLMERLVHINPNNKVYCFVSEDYVLSKNLDNYVYLDKTFNKFDRLTFINKHNKTFNRFVSFTTKNDKFDLIHAHSLFSNGYIAFKTFIKYNIPYIVAVRNSDMNVFFKYIPFIRPLGRKILINASKVIFISKPYQEKCIAKYVRKKDRANILNKSLVIPNGIDEMFLQNKKISSIKHNYINILYVGQVNKNKNVFSTIKACEVLISKKYNVSYTVVGEVLDQKYTKYLNRDFITYSPPVEQKDLIQLYSQNDIFVMPSKAETFGLVYAEAMSQGLPVIYSKGEGFDGNFENGVVGYSVDYNNPEQIAQRIIEITENYDIMSKNCYDLCNKFDWKDIASQYNTIYEELSQ